MTGLKSRFARIHAANASPEKTFAAAMVAAAAEDARYGDCDAYAWLDSPCSLRWLVAVTPEGDDCERVQAALLASIPAPANCPVDGTFQPSETSAYAVQLTLELEVY